MGNQRQQLKENIAADLRTKIEDAQVLLVKFKSEQDDVQKTCVQAKAQIQTTTDLIAQQLSQRQTYLMKEVEFRGHTHVNNLQTNIQNTFLTLGSLQSTLSNLDSFDNSQLLNLQIPTLRLQHSTKPQLVIDTNCEQLIEKIQRWGGVDIPPGRNPAYLDEDDMGLDSEFVAVMNSSEIFYPEDLEQESVPESLSFTPTSELPMKEVTEDGPDMGALQKSDIQQWLEAKLENESDDFELLTMDQEGQTLKMRRGSDDSIVPDLSTSEGTVNINNDSSSIIAIHTVNEKLEPAGTLSDLSMWLKPRIATTNSLNDVSQYSLSSAPVPQEMMVQAPKTTSTVSSKSRFLDYPGLRLDPRCWLPKKPKAQFKLSAELALNMSQKEIIPPTYAALPYPFWLKKC